MKRFLGMTLALPLLAQTTTNFDETFFKGDPKAIMAACADKARQIEPKDNEILIACGRAYLQAGKRIEAEDTFKRAIQLDPKDGDTYQLIGQAWLLAGNKEEAFAAFDQMIKVDPKGRSSIAKAAVNLVDAGFPQEGESMMVRSWEIDASHSDSQKLVAFGSNPGQLPGMWGPTISREGLRHAIFDGWDCLRFGRAALRAKQQDMAARWFARAVQSKPKEEKIWIGIALAYAHGGVEHD